MDTAERIFNYTGSTLEVDNPEDAEPGTFRFTGPQRRRVKHKSRSKSTHAHVESMRCYRCRPAKRPRVATTPMRLRAVNRA